MMIVSIVALSTLAGYVVGAYVAHLDGADRAVVLISGLAAGGMVGALTAIGLTALLTT